MIKISSEGRWLQKSQNSIFRTTGKVNILLALLLLIGINVSACTSAKTKNDSDGTIKNKEKMTVLILGAAGRVGKLLTDDL
jgi:hypothetical protein